MPQPLQPLAEIWVYLATTPPLWWVATLTLIAYQLGYWIYTRGAMNPLLNPVLLAVAALVALLLADGHLVQDLFRRRPIRALSAWPRGGCPCGSAPSAIAQHSPFVRADRGRPAGGVLYGGGDRARNRMGARRVRCHLAVASSRSR